MPSTVSKEIENETSPILEELVRWVKTLGNAGVSPDKAVEVARDFMLASMMAECGEGEDYEEYDEEYDDDDEE